MKRRIAVIGDGNVGGTLGRRWAEAGHDVVFGVRSAGSEDPSRRGIAAAASAAEVVVFAVPAGAAEEAVRAAGDLAGKVVVDCMNPISAGFNGLDQPGGESLAEQVSVWAPGARVVKAFNTIGFNVMNDPDFGGERASLLYCGDDAEAKAAVAGLARDLGFDPVDAGPLVQARSLEWFAWLWIAMAIKYGHGREMAFRLMKRG